MPQLIQSFSLDQISKSGARFDYDKAKWYNSQYIQEQSDVQLAENVKPFLADIDTSHMDDFLVPIASLLKPRIQTYREFPEAASYFFSDVTTYNEKIVRKKWSLEIKPLYIDLKNTLAASEVFEAPHIKDIVGNFVENHGLNFGSILPLLRIAVSGDTNGPDLFAIMEILGKAVTVHRLEKSIGAFDTLIQD